MSDHYTKFDYKVELENGQIIDYPLDGGDFIILSPEMHMALTDDCVQNYDPNFDIVFD